MIDALTIDIPFHKNIALLIEGLLNVSVFPKNTGHSLLRQGTPGFPLAPDFSSTEVLGAPKTLRNLVTGVLHLSSQAALPSSFTSAVWDW